MSLKFAANLSFLFKEKSDLLDRYEAAKDAGFKGVETAFPYEIPIEKVREAKIKSGLQQVLLNSYPGNLTAGDLGHAALPSYVGEFQSGLDLAISYCRALDCKRLHIMAGKSKPHILDKGMGPVYLDNLKYAAEILEKEDIIGLIEPINPISVPGYFLNNFEDAVKYLKEVNSSHIKLQLDIFHLQQIRGNLTQSIKDLLPYIGHIQIAQVPDRHEPNTKGEIDYGYIFKVLEEVGYDGWIGCEYNPAGDTVEGLRWISEYGYSL